MPESVAGRCESYALARISGSEDQGDRARSREGTLSGRKVEGTNLPWSLSIGV